MVNNSCQLLLVESDPYPKISVNEFINLRLILNNDATCLKVCPVELGDVVDVPLTELLEDFFVKIGGLMMLSLDDDDLLLGSVASIS